MFCFLQMQIKSLLYSADTKDDSVEAFKAHSCLESSFSRNKEFSLLRKVVLITPTREANLLTLSFSTVVECLKLVLLINKVDLQMEVSWLRAIQLPMSDCSNCSSPCSVQGRLLGGEAGLGIQLRSPSPIKKRKKKKKSIAVQSLKWQPRGF